MFSVYLCCLVIGGGFSILAAFGELSIRGSPAERRGPVYALRSLVYSLGAFGATGVLLERTVTGMGPGLTLLFALLAALLVGGLVGTLLTFLGDPRIEDTDGAHGGDAT